jgi:hypothetical protein
MVARSAKDCRVRGSGFDDTAGHAVNPVTLSTPSGRANHPIGWSPVTRLCDEVTRMAQNKGKLTNT